VEAMKAVNLESLSEQWTPIFDLLSPIQNENDYEEAVSLLDQSIYAVGNDENHPLATMMYHLGNLIDEYKKIDDDLNSLGKKCDAISTIKFLMDQHGLRQADLKDVFGPQGNVSEVLRGIRGLNLKHIKSQLQNSMSAPLSLLIKVGCHAGLDPASKCK
jgi:HTH-type transcriptional regulator / antitoxin HigA